MSRKEYPAELSAALDRFTVPPIANGFADRVMSAIHKTAPAARDRRGAWTFARRAIIGTVAAGMVSAAAVASGLLGAAGIRVPVLTAMLAPEPKPSPVAKAHKRAVRSAAVVKPPPVRRTIEPPEQVAPADASILSPGNDPRTARRMARIERRAWLREHPELRPVIRQAIRAEHQFVQSNPEIRILRRLPRYERRAFLAERPELQAAMRARQAERRAFRAAHPEAAALIRARNEQRRLEAAPSPVAVDDEGNATAPR
jgi:hypothetical protein